MPETLRRRRFVQLLGGTLLPVGCAGTTSSQSSDWPQRDLHSTLDALSHPPPLPGLTTLGLGYDGYASDHRLRNRVLAFDYAVHDEAWVSSTFGGIYQDPETDTRYMIPAAVGFDHENQRGEGHVTVSESRSHFESSFSESLTVGGSYGLFSASVSESFSTSSSTNSSSWFSQRTQEVQLWNLWVSDGMTLDAAFVAAIEALPDDSDGDNYERYAAVIEIYGVLVVTFVTLGGRVEYNAITETSAYETSEEVEVSFEASYGINFDASGSADYAEQASGFESNSDITVNVVGGDASEAGMLMDNGGSTLEWSKTVQADPAVMTSAYVHLYDVVDPGTFGEEKRDALRRAVHRYSREEYPTVDLKIEAGKSDGSTTIKIGDGAVVGNEDYQLGAGVPSIRVTRIDSQSLAAISDDYFIPYDTEVEFADQGLSASEQAIAGVTEILQEAEEGDIVVVATCIAPAMLGMSDPRVSDVVTAIVVLLSELTDLHANSVPALGPNLPNYVLVTQIGEGGADYSKEKDTAKLTVVFGDDTSKGRYVISHA